jgi:hypothetical protein
MNSLEALVALAISKGVDLDVWEDAERIDLHWIERTSGAPGSGAEMLGLLCDYADRTNRRVILQVARNATLEAYYSQWGFEYMEDEEVPDHYPDWPEIMLRPPKQTATSCGRRVCA